MKGCMSLVKQNKTALIAVVDGEEATRDIAKAVLAEAGFETAVYEHAAEAICHFNEHAPDLVILGTAIADQDGVSVCRAIREIPACQDTSIVLLTAKDDPDSVRAAYQAGASDFISKPINWTLFTHRVRFALRAAQHTIAHRDKHQRLHAATRLARLGYLEVDLSNDRLHCNEELLSILEAPGATALPDFESFLSYIPLDQRNAVRESYRSVVTSHRPAGCDFTLQLADGRQRTVISQAEVVVDANQHPLRLAATVLDVTQRADVEKKLAFLTHYDPVTSLPNRALFLDRLDVAIRDARRYGRQFAVIIVDIDRLKDINESYGHDFGDEVLRLVAQLIRASVRESDSVARCDGDEFALIINQLTDPKDAIRSTNAINDLMKTPLRYRNHEVYATFGIGVAIYPHDSTEADTLIKNAEAAMHEAKRAGRGQSRFFTEDMNRTVRERLQLETELRHAAEHQEFLLCYQPQVMLQNGKVWGAEALIRWKHPHKGLIPPDQFIPVLEDTGQIITVGQWALREACNQIASWNRRGFNLTLSVNLSAKQFNDPELLKGILRALDDTGVDPQQLELELTESTLISEQKRALDIMRAIRSHGVRLSIDDFGTGYSSLSYLKKLPVNHLKVDRSFVMSMVDDEDDRIIVQSTVDLAHNLGLGVIAEGIETVRALQLLKEMNCDVAQGFYIGRPLEPTQFDAWLKGYRK